VRRALLLFLLASAVLVAHPSPASAHGVGGREPSNLRNEIVGLEGVPAGVAVRLVELDTKLELRNTSGTTVVVLGYDGEPYLQVGPDGVFENTRSPARFVNRTLDPPGEVPAGYDAAAPPEWRRMSTSTAVRWHDHRAHWMGDDEPDARTPWTVPLLVDGARGEIRGAFETVAAPPWWPWPVVAVALALVVAVAARRKWRVAAACALGGLLAAEVLHVAGSWSAMASSFDDRLGAQALSVLAVVVSGVALARVLRTDAYDAAPWALFAAVVMIAVGAGDVLSWTRSQLPSSLAPPLVRALVAAVLGGAVGLVVAAATRLRAPEAPRERLGP